MIPVKEVYDFVSFIINKNNTGSFTPKGFNIAAKAANIAFFDELRGGSYSSYQPGRPVATIGMEENMILSAELDPFIKKAAVNVVNGVGVYPSDLVQNLGMQLGSKKVTWVRKEALPDHLDSAIDPPSFESPIYTNVGKSWEFYPNTLTAPKLYYLKSPVDPVYAYTAIGPKATYSNVGSIDFEWNRTAFLALSAKILSFLGVNLSSDQLVGYSENMKSETK